MAASEITSVKATEQGDRESREARVVRDPEGNPNLSLNLSPDQLVALGVDTTGETVEYYVKGGELRFE